MKMDKKTIGKIIAGLLTAVMLLLVFAGSALSAETGALHEREVDTNAIAYITAAEAEAMLQSDPNVVLLDVRTAAEFSSGHLQGARCVPVSELRAQAGVLDRDARVVVYADSDAECAEACGILAESGFGRVYNLHGGIEVWREKGVEVSGAGEAKVEREVKRGGYSKCDSCDMDSMRHASFDRVTDAPQKMKTTTSTGVKTTAESESSTTTTKSKSGPIQFTFRTNKGGDLDRYMPCKYPGTFLHFDINVDVKGLDASDIEEARLALRVKDVDFECFDPTGKKCERDWVYFNSHRLGLLRGANDKWTEPEPGRNTFKIKPEWIKEGANHVMINIDFNTKEYWCVECDWGELTVQTNVYKHKSGVQLKPGDILFRHKGKLFVDYYHNAIYAGNGKIIQADTPALNPLPGLEREGYVEKIPIKNFSKRPWKGATTVLGYNDDLPPAEKKEKRRQIVANAEKYTNDPEYYYNIHCNPDDTKRGIYCSQLVYLAYNNTPWKNDLKNGCMGYLGFIWGVIRPSAQYKKTLYGRIPGSGELKATTYFDDSDIPPLDKGQKTTTKLRSNSYFTDLSDEEEEPEYIKIHKVYPDTTVSHLKAIDPTVSEATFVLSWQSNSSNLNLTLYKPDGSVADDANITHEKNTALAYEYYTVSNPEPGNWTMNITAIDVPEEGEDYIVMAWSMGNLTLFLSAENYWCNLNESITIMANLTNDDTPLPGANVTAEIYKPDDSVFNITLSDDGTHSDTQADDGVYSNVFTPLLEGSYLISTHASGTVSDYYFTREAVTEIAVRKQTAKFTDSYSDCGTDTDGDGLYNFLTVEAEANVTTAGNYTINALLHDENGTEVVSISNYAYLDAGIQTLELNFDGFSIYNHKANGTYNLSLELYDEYETPIDYKYDAYTTSAYNYTDFQRPVVALTGCYSDYGTDTNGNGLYDYLTIDVGVNVANSGDYAINARIMTDAGEEIIWASNTSYLTADQPQTMQLNFDGRYIYGTMANGSFRLRDVYVYSIDDSTLSDHVYDAYTTSVYNYTDFEKAGIIIGKVTDENGTSVSDALVSINSGVDYDYTNETGNYSLTVPQNGTYTITASPPPGVNLVPNSTTVYVTVGQISVADIILPEGGILMGNVTDTKGLAVCNAYVTARGTAFGYAYTDTNGTYTVAGLETETYTITASPPPEVNLISESASVHVTMGEVVVHDFVLKEGGIIKGIVTDETGIGVSGAYIYVSGPTYKTNYTNESGYYTIAGLKNGTYTVTVAPPPEENLVGDSDSVHTTVGETTFCNFTLQEGGIITGRVTDVNGTGIQDAWVEASDFYYTFWKYDTTNSTGYYSIKGLPNNTYAVTAYPPYEANLVSDSTTVIVTQGQTTITDFTLHEGGIITGTVTYENGTGIPNVEIEADGTGYGWAYTNTTGGYTIYGLKSGTYTVTAYAPYESGLIDSSTTASVSAGETTIVNLILHHPATITGRITDESGTGIQNAQVSISSATTWDDTYTDYNGYYTITGLEEGNCYISAYPPSGTNLVSNSTSIYIKAGQTTTVNLTLEEGGILTGRVTDRNGIPIYNARVIASEAGYGYDYTNSSGYYEIIGLRTGTYRIETHGKTRTNLVNVTCIEITQKETTTLNIILHEGGMVTGRVTNEYGVGVSNTYVCASGPIYVSANTNSTGYYTIEGLINGTYIVTASGYYGSGLVSNPIGADIIGCETIEINFTMRVGGIIAGRVTDENGLPIADIDVDVYSTQGYESYGWAYTDYNGYYTITGLQTGEYTVIAFGSWYGLADNSTTAFVQLGETTTVNFILQEGGTLTGEVTYENGTAASFVDVSASGKSQGYDETDLSGHYTIPGLQDGEYTIIASEYSTNLVNRTTATVTSGETTTANITLHEGGIVMGRVTDVNETEIVDAWVGIFTSTTAGYYWYGYYNGNQTNSTGYYIIEGIPDGTYNISASPPYEYCIPERDLAENSSIITVTQGQTTVCDFTLQKGGAIKGKVATRDGNEVAGAFVSAEGLSYGYTYTDPNGNYTITKLQAGTYDVWAYPPSGLGLSSNSTSADISIGQAALNIDIVLSSNPIALFDYSPPNPVVNRTITFNASSSYDPDGTIVKYEWDFGDGNTTTTTENITTHSYTLEGYYNVILTVTNDNGAANQTSKIITVTILRGDLSRDGILDSADAAIVLEIAVGSRPFDDAADVNDDGKITSLDALMILQAAVGNIKT